MKKYFVSFGSSDFQLSVTRLQNQALSLNYFADATVMTEHDLGSTFRQQFQSRLVKGSRGYGYWCWKPQVILQTLAKMNDGDVLLYCDVGCHLTSQGGEIWMHCLRKLRPMKAG